MISRWRIENFKSVRDAELDLRPLTILSGVNSSGKSTILQSMAVIAQTAANQIEQEALILNGYLVSLGDFRNIHSTGPSTHVTIGWQLKPLEVAESGESADDNLLQVGTYATRDSLNLGSINCQVRFREDGFLHPLVEGGTLKVEGQSEAAASFAWSLRGKGSESNEWNVELDADSADRLQKDHADASSAMCELRHFLPSRLSVDVARGQRDAAVRADYLCGSRVLYKTSQHPLLQGSLPDEVRALLMENLSLADNVPASGASLAAWVMFLDTRSSTDGWRERLERLREKIVEGLTRGEDAQRRGREHVPLPGSLPRAIFYIESFFATKFKYLGPLRDEPRSVYAHPTKLDPIDIGRRGEHTAAVYHAYRKTPVLHIDSESLSEFGPIGDTVTARLEDAVNDWLRYLGVADHVVSREEKHGHVLEVGNKPDAAWEILHVGTGVSQVLPILLLGLLAQGDDTLVVEHPELHLHPRVQSRLADFFLFLALNGRQVIVETHSEHVINRLRRRVATDRAGHLGEYLAIAFAERVGDVTSFRKVEVNKYGMIESWPEGFFDEAIEESELIVRAAIERNEETE